MMTAFGGFLKQSTAVTLKLGPAVDATDGATKETALTITSSEILLTKNGSALTAKNESTSAAHDSGGVYSCLLDTTDTNTVGILGVYMSDTAVAHRPFMTNYMVLPANVYDSLFGGTDNLIVDVQEIGDAAIDTATAQIGVNVVSLANDAITAASIAADAIGSSELATAAIDEIVAAMKAELTGSMHSGTLQAGAASTATLAAGASSTNDKYKFIVVKSAAGVLQFALITGYVGATKVATVSPAWTTVPDNTYQYAVFAS